MRAPSPRVRRLTLAAPHLFLLLYATAALAQARVDPPEEAPATIMGVLARRGLHDLEDERWNAYGQFTFISTPKLPFPAPYTNVGGSTNSLLPEFEHSFTATLTLSLGVRLWPGGQLYFVPEAVSERPLSNLRGLGGAIQNFELQKGGSPRPTVYRSRLYLRQTFNLGGDDVAEPSGPTQLARKVKSRRVALVVGNFSALDFFERNSVTGDPRRNFFNLAFLTHAAWDFAADARGYAWGGVVELVLEDFEVRLARLTPPVEPNQLELDFHLLRFYGDQLEVAHAHRLFGQPGVLRLLGFRNHENLGRYADAVAAFRADPSKNAAACTAFNYGSQNPTAPDLCWVRAPHIKLGAGLSLEQAVSEELAVFFRGLVSDGQGEVYSYTSTDASLSLGAVTTGGLWGRAVDTFGVAYAQGRISAAHAEYLGLGGIDGFIGDGRLTPAAEHVFETFYSAAVAPPLWLSLDYQRIWHPAYNADRGPVNVLGARAHAEF